MLNAKDIKKRLTLKNIIRLMDYFKADPKQHEDKIQSQTVCHDGDSHKLYYYDNRKLFVCYTNCGSFDVFELIQKIKGVEFKDAFLFLKRFFGFSNGGSHVYYDHLEDPYQEYKKELKKPKLKRLPAHDPKILDDFDNIAYINWIREGISIPTMQKFHIKLSIPDEEIIIPEYDHDSRLIGIRCRHLDKSSVARGRKYTPINYHGRELNYPTGQILYGLNFNKDAINRHHKVILFEAEKSVLKLDSVLGDDNISLGLNGSHLTDEHLQLLNSLNVHEVMIALDKEFDHPGTKKERIYAEQIESEFSRLKKYFNLSVIWDRHDILNPKSSPIDEGYDKFKKLLKERMFL